jgi:streptogramin lyase
MRYQTNSGLIPDVLKIANSGFQSYNTKSTKAIGREVPVYGVLKDYKDLATGSNPNNPRAEAMQGVALTGTIWYMDIIHEMFVSNVNKLSKEGE